MIIIFVTLWFLERALRNNQNASIRDLCYGYPLKTPDNYNIRDLSHGCYLSKLLIFPTSVTYVTEEYFDHFVGCASNPWGDKSNFHNKLKLIMFF
jgi:hypothetical protein